MKRSIRMGGWAALAMLVNGLGAQDKYGLPPEVLTLARIKVRMEETLNRLPNYTCLQVIERSRRPAASRRFELVDILRLEVALVDGKELFAWPGERKFEERELRDLAPSGAIGNGDFALHARSIFLSSTPQFRSVGEEPLEGRPAIRYDFTVSAMLSGYRISVPPHQAIVPYRGSFWADPATLEVRRLEVIAEEIPPELRLSEARTVVDYARRPIGDAEFLLPVAAALEMTDERGNSSLNRTTYTECHQYVGEIVVRFDEAPEDEGAEPPPDPVIRTSLPADLRLETALDVAIDSSSAVVGDEVRAILLRDLKQEKRLIAPKGAVLNGRIVRLAAHRHPVAYYEIGLKFLTLEFGDTVASLRTVLESGGGGSLPGAGMPSGQALYGAGGERFQITLQQQPDDHGVLFWKGTRARIPRGHRLRWRTVAQEPVRIDP
jgi:hypothetical protein